MLGSATHSSSCACFRVEGLFTPYVYVRERMIDELGVEPVMASYFLSVLGAFSTVSRIITGILADRPQIDCLILHNGAAIVAGIATCFVPFVDNYYVLLIYSAVFGVFTGTSANHR